MNHITLTVSQIKTKLNFLNEKLDQHLIRLGLSKPKKKMSHFENELPVFIQEFLINYGAGITLDRSLKLTLSAHKTDELLEKQLSINTSAIEALNKFATQQDCKEVWRFVKLINQLHLTGAITTIAALEKYHDELWQNKLTKARMKSEKISILLTFLLMLSLISVIMVVLTPVMLML